MDTQVLITLAVIIAYFAIVKYKKFNSSSNSTSSNYKKNKEIPLLTDEKAIQLFDYLRLDYRRLSRNTIEFYNPIGAEYCIDLFKKSEREDNFLGKEYIVYEANFIKPFLNIFDKIKAAADDDFVTKVGFPFEVFYLTKEIDKIEFKDLVNFVENITSILGNPYDIDEEINLSMVKRSLKKDMSSLHLQWKNAFKIWDEEGDLSEHFVLLHLDSNNLRYILWIA
ncbi:hypothetical protein PBAC_19500 [Pedobacter glucosidilyticus]|nr:hypothetical protein [Pedobacter glucosidilyticus]KHJ37790.1 hypothetical protein PBAC_19500 [Pedobacter glucosidilyticus]